MKTRNQFLPLAAAIAAGIVGLSMNPAAAATSAYRNLVLGDGPIVYYEFDETSGTTASNSATTGATYDGTFNTAGGSVTVGQPSFAQGGTAYDFGGGFVGAASALTSSLDEWTAEAWVNYDAAKTSASNFLSNDQGGWNDDVLFGIGAEAGSQGVPAGSVGLIQHGNPGSTRDFAGSPLVAGEWHHVVMTGSTLAGTLTLYINGVLAGSDTTLVNGITFNGADGFGAAPNLTIGAARPNSGDAGYRPYDGLLDEVAVYDSVLDASTVTDHYNAGFSTAGTPPGIVARSPTDGASEVPLASSLLATFSEPLVLTNTGTVTIRNLTLGSGSDVTIGLPDVRVSTSGAILTIDPATDFDLNTNYAVRISADAVEDLAGDAFAGIGNDSAWNFTTAAQPSPPNPSGFGLEVSEYAPGDSDPAVFKLVTHIAFGPGGQEIVTDLRNNRFLYRDGPDDPLQVSPIPVRGQHSVVYNAVDSLYYANDTENNRLISFADLSSATITAQTNNILGVPLSRPHDIVIDPATGWIYALNPNSGHVFRFSAIGQTESVLNLGGSLGGYSRSLTFANGRLYVIGSAAGRIVEVVDWDTGQITVYNSFGKIRGASAGSWTTTGLVLNDAEYFNGFWYATSYFSPTHAGGTDPNENKFIRFATLPDLVTGNWEDLSSLVPDGLTPYYLTAQGDSLYLAVFDHAHTGGGDDVILRFTPTTPFSITDIEHDAVADATTLTWESNGGEVFEVHKSLDLDSWMVVEMQIPAAAAPSQTTTAIVDTNAIESRAFYRVGRLTGEE